MICKINCTISLIFIIATIYFNLTIDKNDIYLNYVKKLDDDQVVKYNKIVSERKNISLMGYLYGLCLSVVFILVNYNFKKINRKMMLCVVGTITFLTHYFYYILSPKSDYMILHLKEEQMKDWLYVYKSMQHKYHAGFVIGIISVMFLSYSFKCN
mgnify:FL=1